MPVPLKIKQWKTEDYRLGVRVRVRVGLTDGKQLNPNNCTNLFGHLVDTQISCDNFNPVIRSTQKLQNIKTLVNVRA